MREERRVVTALSADLVGSTALAERLDPEEARLIVGEAVARIVHAVEEFGGTVKDLAGDGILALFGAPTAHEDDAERAAAGRAADRRGASRTTRARSSASFGVAGLRRPRRRRHRPGRRRPGRRRRPRRVRRDGRRGQRRRAAAVAGRAGNRARRRRRPAGSVERLFAWGEPAGADAQGQGRAGAA